MRSRGKTNAHNKNRLIFFFMLFLLAAERADASTNDRLLDRDAQEKDERIMCRHFFLVCFFSWRKRSDVLWPRKTTTTKKVGRDKRVKTSPLFTPTVRRVVVRFRHTKEVKLQLQVGAQRGRGFNRSRKLRDTSFPECDKSQEGSLTRTSACCIS